MRPFKRSMFSQVSTLFLSLLVLILSSCSFRYGHYTISSNAMFPLFEMGDVVEIDHSAYKNARPQRGDVVLLELSDGQRFVRRIVGLPHESVRIVIDVVYINGEVLDEPYATFLESRRREFVSEWELAEDHYIVLGDLRINSIDSRNFGPIMLSNITGKVLID